MSATPSLSTCSVPYQKSLDFGWTVPKVLAGSFDVVRGLGAARSIRNRHKHKGMAGETIGQGLDALEAVEVRRKHVQSPLVTWRTSD